MTHEEFLDRFKQNPHYSHIELLGKYKNKDTKIPCRCKKCGHEWYATPECLYKRGNGCKVCSSREFVEKSVKIPFEKKKELLLKSCVGNVYEFISEKYDDKKQCKILVRCKKCNKQSYIIYHSLLKAQNCKNCLQSTMITNNDGFVKEFYKKEIHKNLSLQGVYTNAYTKIKCKCNVCGFEWSGAPDVLLNHGCRKCAAKKRGEGRFVSKEEFQKRLNKKKFNITIISEYKSMKTPITTRCNIHNIEKYGLQNNYLTQNMDVIYVVWKKQKSLKD